MDVVIFGAGIAGLMTAIALRAQGCRCHIYERNSQTQDAGMGFILMAEGIAWLERFGVQLAGPLAGVSLARYRHRRDDGEVLEEQSMPAGSRSFRRRDLIAALMRSLPADAITFGAELDGLDFDAEGRATAARLKGGAGGGVKAGPVVTADLYVAADGIGSRARQALFPDWPMSYARMPEVVGLVESPDLARWAGRDFNKFHAPEGGLAFGVLPVDSDHLVWFLQFDAQRFLPTCESAAECRAFVQRLVGGWAHPVPRLLALTDFRAAHLWRPVDTDLLPCFHQENLVLVGDAAHPFLPLTSQGVSAAIADAVTLATLLRSSGNDISQALVRYSVERRKQCSPYITKGRELTRTFLSPQHAGRVVLPMA
jgi:2-polyprenyl-6-methoxyphenol hydroxylase-like FAD-dependent oxidoreductase